jgi:hypothetical protein
LIGPPAVDAKPQQNSQIVEIIKDVKQLKSVVAKPQQQLIGPPAVDAKPQQNSQIVEIIKDVKQLKSVVAKLVAKPQQQLIGPPAVDAKPQQQLIAAPADTAALQDISKSLARITQLLTQQNSQVTAEANQERKNQENAKRKKVELGLENSFASVKNVAQAVVAPVKNILDQIIQFFVTLFLGKAILNLIDWFSKKENQSKIRSIARFLQTFWPALVAAYILFGTGFGRVVRNLASIGLRAVVGLGGITLKLIGAIAKATGFKKAGALMSGLGGGGGLKGLAARLLTGAAVAGGTALVANKMMGGGDAPQVSVPEPATLPTAEAFGGGLIDFKTMLAASGGQVDSKLGIFAQLFGSGGFAGLMNNVPGVVIGPKGIDKVPAMLTDGEFVMSRGAVQKFGVSNLEAMNAAGGGTNKPKIVQKRIYATTGGFIGSEENKKMMDKGDIDDKELRTVYDTRHGLGTYDKEKPPVEDKNDVKLNLKPTSGPGAMQPMSTQADMNALSNKIRFNERITKIKNEMQSKKALASGKGVNIKGAGLGSDIGTGYGTKYKGKNAIKVKLPPGGSYETEITLAGQRYFAIKKGDDVIYVEQDKRDIGGGGMFQPGGLFGGPRMSARSDYAASKGKYYSSADKKTYANENDAKAARQSRMTSLASQQGLNKLSYAKRSGQYGLGVRGEAERASRKEDFDKRGGIFGGIGRGFTRMFGGGEQIEKLDQQDKAASIKTKQAGAESIGKYYSSSDGKYYANFAAADKARIARKAKLGATPVKGNPITPTPKPAPKVYNPGGGGMNGARGGKPPKPKKQVPSIPAGGDNRKTANQYGIGSR